MSLFELDGSSSQAERAPVPPSEIDVALTAQIVVAWAGEAGEGDGRRLAWWKSDLVSEYGGVDLFQRLLPSTWRWAVLQAARETARRADAAIRQQDHDPDRIISLFRFGFELDERLDERLQDLKRSETAPQEALPGLDPVFAEWDPETFFEWVRGHGEVDTVAGPIGRRIKGDPPSTFGELVRRLVAGFAPAADAYPLPHYRSAK